MSAALDWRTVTPSREPRYMVKGTVLNSALYGEHSRFLIEEVRAYPNGYQEPDVTYRVRDALTVSDAMIRDGIGSKSVGTFATLKDATNFCDTFRPNIMVADDETMRKDFLAATI